MPNVPLRVLCRISAIAAVIACGATITATASATTSGRMTRIVSPAVNQVVGHAGVNVVLRSSVGLDRLRLSVDGYNVKPYFHRSGSTYRATLRVGRGLHLGVDELLVVTGKDAELDDVSFIVARRAAKLLALRELNVGGSEAPVRVVARLARGTTLQAWVNGHPDTGAFEPTDHGYVGLLGANDWLRAGENHVLLRAYRTSPSGRYAVYDSAAGTFWRKPGRLTAGAGPDRITTAGQFIRLHGEASELGAHRAPRVTYRWRIVARPHGAGATLYGARTASPGLVADGPGEYLIAAKVVGRHGASSVDTAVVTARADAPPMGAPLDSAADDQGTITLDGTPVANTTEACNPGTDGLGCANYGSYAIFNRQTLELVTSGTVDAGTSDGMKKLFDLASSYDRAPTYLMVVSFGRVVPDAAQLQYGKRLLELLGAPDMDLPESHILLTSSSPKSIIGVPGSPPGSAFLSHHFIDGSSYTARSGADMSGYLRLNPLSTTGNFEFVFADQVEFDTDVSPTRSQVTMQVGAKAYAHDVPAGTSGFFLLRFDSRTLALEKDFFYVTNRADGRQDPSEAQRMARDIAWASSPPDNGGGGMLIMLQSFGLPKGTSADWLLAAQAIGKLGGNAQEFAQLNQGLSDEPHPGRYAFVGRAAMDVPAASSSQALTGKPSDGILHGLLARGRDDQYEPMIADPTGTVNFQLVQIVNRPSPAGGGFPAFTKGEQAAATFLGRDPDIIGVCDPAAPSCDVRKAYYEDYTGVNWVNILTRLGTDATKAKCAQSHPDFTPADCNAVRQEFELEIGRRNEVEEYFGPKGLQAPFLGGVQVAALVDVAKIADQIKQAVQLPDRPPNATANALDIISFAARAAGLAAAIHPAVGPIAAGVSGAFGLAGYLTRQNGAPDLLGPKLNTAAADLGSDLYDRYQRASSYFTVEAKIIMSDWSKLSEVAAAVASNPKWHLGDIATSVESMRLGTKQAIYESLIPVAFPVLYDLGTGVAHAMDWKCIGRGFLVDKHLFQYTEQDAELTWIMTDNRYLGEAHVLAAGKVHAQDTLHAAYIKPPPETLMEPVFRQPDAPQGGGIGLYKLEFYSPQYFKVFHEVLQQRDGDQGFGYYYCGDMPDPPGNSD